MIQEVGSTPATVIGGGGFGGEGWGGGLMGIILIIALLGGGLGFGGWGRREGCGDGHDFGLQRDILINRAIGEKDTCAIIQNQDACTGRILDKMTNIEMQNLRDKISGLETVISEQKITATILGSLQPPRPIPAYPVPNPYIPFGNQGCGFGYGYGCGA
jgi:hypothetical protein